MHTKQVIETLINICNTEHIACDIRNLSVLIEKVKKALPTVNSKTVAEAVRENVS